MRNARRHLVAMVVGAACAVALLAPAPASAAWEVVGGEVAQDTSLPSFDLKEIGGRPYVAYVRANGVLSLERLRADGTGWEGVGRPVNRGRPARAPSLAAGPGGVPWIAWTEPDREGVNQIRVAHLGSNGEDWVEPDGRDWEINRIQRDYPYDRRLWSAVSARLVFLGDRPYLAVWQNNPVEYELNVVRLAADAHSWELIAHGVVGTIPQRPDSVVTGGLLHVGGTDGWDTAVVDRLNADGRWTLRLGGGTVNTSVMTPGGSPRSGDFNRLAGLEGEPYVLWSGGEPYVAHLVDGAWRLAGGTSVSAGRAGYGASLRTVGGRLYAAWIADDRPAALHVSRLADDGSAWIATDDALGFPVSGGAALAGVGGIPYAAWVESDGSTARLLVARLEGAPAPIGPDDAGGSGPGEDPVATGVPLLPPRGTEPPPEEPPAPIGPCGLRLDGTLNADTLTGGQRAETIRGFESADTLLGGGGNDCLLGGGGNDLLRGGGSEDRVYGGAGDDVVFGGVDEDLLAGGRGDDTLTGGGGWDSFLAGAGDDTVHAADGRAESVSCGAGHDRARVDRFDRTRGCERVTVVRK